MDTIKQNVKTFVGDISEDLLSLIISQTKALVLNKIKALDINVVEIPKELEYIVVELSVIRFNLIGSEGMKSENIEGHSISFGDDIYNQFDKDILEWYSTLENSDKGIQFIWDMIN